MARAAVKAKQQAKAKAQPNKSVRKRVRRGHAGGGNPNQDLFFVRLRRRQKWIYAFLAIIFALTFAGVGVGSGNGGGLSDLYTGLGGSGGSSVSKAQAEIKKNPAKGYRQLATAYETNGDTAGAVSALQSYLALKKKDANVWAELGGIELTQAQTALTQYQSAQQAAQFADPSAPFLPGGTLAGAVGTNAAYQSAAQQASRPRRPRSTSRLRPRSRRPSPTIRRRRSSSLTARLRSRSWRTVAENAGNASVAISAWKRYLKIDPNSPQRAQVERQIKQLKKSLAPAPKPKASSSNGKK